jgi:hypothetical protein
MTKPIIRIHNSETDEIIDREMTDEEYAEYQAQQVKDVAMSAALEQAKADKAALLAKLGITADEAKLLLS